MRLLVVNYEFPPVGGGGATACRYLTRELVRRGHQVDVLTSRCFGLAAREDVDGATVYRVPVVRRRLDYCSVREMVTFLVSAPPKALLLASRRRYDLVHVYFGLPCGPIGWLLKRTHGLPYLIRMGGGDVPGFKPHGYERHYRRVTPFVKLLWDDADALIAVSADLAERVRQIHPGGRVPHILPNGVDLKEFLPPKTPRPFGVVDILTVSRLISRKRLDMLLAAVLRLRSRTHVPFRVRIVGDGVDRPALESFVVTTGLSDIVSFLGAVPHEQLPEVYRAADIFVLSSLAEGMPNVVLEALATGLPLVMTDTGGSLELVIPDANGYIVPKNDTAALVDHLRALVEQPELRKRCGERSRERASLFSWSVVTDRTEALYAEILARHTRAGERGSLA